MQKQIPVTYNFPFKHLNDEVRKIFFHDFAVNGGKYVVLGAGLLPQMISRPELPEMVAAELAAENLEFMDSHAPFGLHWDVGSPFEKEKAARLLRMKLSIELANYFSVKTMTIHLGKKAPEVSYEERLEAVCRTLDELLPFAEEKKVTLCLENGFAYLGYPRILLEIKERYPEETLGFCFDAGHANMSLSPDPERQQPAPTLEEFADIMLPHMVNCHLHDNDGSHDLHDLPGRGCVDWEMLAGKLQKAPRLQVIQSEVNMVSNTVSLRELTETFNRIFG